MFFRNLMTTRKILLQDIVDNIGIINANLSILKSNKAKAIRFSILEVICKELNCKPGDILEYTEY
ncbi:hypothetical protein CFB3_43630 [Clostridium folliculivorans]|uniref:HTH cro/C1-type domain-containing protein n=2 Tax=Clostridium folliculivorans TaxID=2886038 RepID=A0A9W6DCK2_9CLOT|nr:hypothetical protein CFOLD11_42310 [Clostridium folliculivorans]GKU32255.1 hypothetical protein CFB3_43630 [Clostridium folliculivorans]